MKVWRILIVLAAAGALLSCTDPAAEEPQQALEPPHFVQVEDPKVFFANYLEDLSGDRYLPPDLFKMLAERTRMKFMVKPFQRHDPYALLQWYYSDIYLGKVREAVDEQLKSMDYQLEVMDISRDLAARIMMVAEAGPIEHKRQLLNGGLSQKWSQYDATRYEVLLTNGDWNQLVGIGLEEGRWKLRIFGPVN